MSSFGTGFRNRRGVLVGVGFLISVAFYTASWVPWNVHSEHYGGRYRDVDLNTGSDMSFQSSSSSGRDFDWESITPSTTLEYHPCFDRFQCARLSVPLDHLDPTNLARAYIAILKVPSTVPETDPTWGGPILINPGGPGGSGVDYAKEAGTVLQGIVGGTYSIVGFDPRGVNNTVPRMSCFPNPLERNVWAAKGGGRVLGSTGGGKDAQLVELGEHYVRARMLAGLCNRESKAAVKYLGTANTARDMRLITAAHWKGKVDTDGNPRKKGLQYWGLSYGSVLGITFSAMFPSEVERVVVDGVVDVPDYYAGMWSTNLVDTEEVMASFYQYCSLAGPLKCAFHTGTSPLDIKSRLNSLLISVKQDPIPSILCGGSGCSDGTGNDSKPLTQSDMITYSDLRNIIFIALYSPLTRFPILASLLASIEARDPTALVKYKSTFDIKPFITCPSDPTPRPPHLLPPDDLHAREATPAILCSDAPFISPSEPASSFLPYLTLLRSQSQTSADIWAQIRMSCVGWLGRAVEPPPPILTRPAPHENERIETKNPVLLVSTSLDPVTPVANARKMRKWFREAGVLVQEGPGHCSVNAPSTCAAELVRTYFDQGKVPGQDDGNEDGEKWCGMEVTPFLGKSGRHEMQGKWEAGQELGNWEGMEKLERVGNVVARLGGVGAGWM